MATVHENSTPPNHRQESSNDALPFPIVKMSTQRDTIPRDRCSNQNQFAIRLTIILVVAQPLV